MRGGVFLRSLAVFAGAFMLAHGLRLLPSNPGTGGWLLLFGTASFLGGLGQASAEENMLAQVVAAYLAAILLAGLVLLLSGGR